MTRLQPCGTVAAFARHRNHGEEPCEPCKAARLAYDQARRANPPGPRVLAPCGTYAAYQRHRSNAEDPCEPCKQANRDYKTEWARQARARRQAFDDMLAEVLAELESETA